MVVCNSSAKPLVPYTVGRSVNQQAPKSRFASEAAEAGHAPIDLEPVQVLKFVFHCGVLVSRHDFPLPRPTFCNLAMSSFDELLLITADAVLPICFVGHVSPYYKWRDFPA